MGRYFMEMAVFSAIYLLACVLSIFISAPILWFVTVPYQDPFIFVRLTHGVCVICTWLLGSRAFIWLLPGIVVHAVMFSAVAGIGVLLTFSVAVAFAAIPYVAFRILIWFDLADFASERSPKEWRGVLAAGTLAAAIQSATVFGGTDVLLLYSVPIVTKSMILFLSQMLGLLAVLLILRMSFRIA